MRTRGHGLGMHNTALLEVKAKRPCSTRKAHENPSNLLLTPVVCPSLIFTHVP